jgi:hypothetical protein
MFIIWFFENPLGRSSLAQEFGMNFNNEKIEEIQMHPLRNFLRVNISYSNIIEISIQNAKMRG